MFERKAEDVLIEMPGLFGIAAAVGEVMKRIDPHCVSSVLKISSNHFGSVPHPRGQVLSLGAHQRHDRPIGAGVECITRAHACDDVSKAAVVVEYRRRYRAQ